VNISLQWAFSFLILIGLNWWMKPLEYCPRDVNAWPHLFLKYIVKPVARPEPWSEVHPMTSHEIPSDSTETEVAATPLMMEYRESRSNDPSSVSADENTKL